MTDIDGLIERLRERAKARQGAMRLAEGTALGSAMQRDAALDDAAATALATLRDERDSYRSTAVGLQLERDQATAERDRLLEIASDLLRTCRPDKPTLQAADAIRRARAALEGKPSITEGADHAE